MKQLLSYLFEYQALSREKAKDVLCRMAAGEYNEHQMAAFLTVYNMRPMTVAELLGFRDAMHELCVRVDLSGHDTIDLCGTGGDGKDTFNMSTLASFVVAGAGYKVAKHGNYGVSSGCGSSNVLENLGYVFPSQPDIIRKTVDEVGICFIHAPLFHPAMKIIGPIRKQLGVKTFFNMLGPLTNPSMPKRQVIGVYNLELLRLYTYVHQQTDKHYNLVHSLEGYDEVSLTCPVKVMSNNGEQLLLPKDFGFQQVKPEQIKGGNSVNESTEIFRAVIDNKGTEAQKSAVLANAALGIRCFKPNQSLIDCVAEARESLESKRALTILKKLIN